jgi:hypothetical protein
LHILPRALVLDRRLDLTWVLLEGEQFMRLVTRWNGCPPTGKPVARVLAFPWRQDAI